MSQENVEIARKSAAAFERGDYASALEAFHPEVVYTVTPSTGPEPGIFHGHEGIQEAFRRWMDSWEKYETGVDEVIDAGDYVIAVGWDRGRAKGSGATVERRDVAFLYRFRDRKIEEAWMYATKDEALEAAGLSE
jgi:ketosteroid isomerase-like protein